MNELSAAAGTAQARRHRCCGEPLITDHICRKQIYELTSKPFIRKHKNTKIQGKKRREGIKLSPNAHVHRKDESSGFWGKHSFFLPIQMFQPFRSSDEEKRIRLLFLWGVRLCFRGSIEGLSPPVSGAALGKLTGPPTSGGRRRPVLWQ